MKRKVDPPQRETEQYEAYGEYAYSYDHSKEAERSAGRKEPQEQAAAPEENAEPTPQQREAMLSAAERAKAHSRVVTTRLIFVLAAMVLTLILLQSFVFRLTTVYVIGNVTKTPQQVAAESGLVKGLNMFSITEDEVRENLSADHKIILLGVQKEFPGTIYLYISEREAVASIQWLGLLYTLDDEGFVLDEENSTAIPEGIPSVIGLQVTSIHVGQKLEVRNQAQMQAYYNIVSELGLQYYRDQVTEMNLADTDNLFLQTVNGISIRLGTSDYMRAKIGAVRTDLPYLQQLGKTSGVLDVSTPEDAKYSPDS
ncbi:MAG: FtsQ-type POTRA domain-containing protein [Eubacteriales bacterium]|nr:FtsQ-type POTRA domain-containing protein [Eubacteriales bacterium]